MKRVLPFFVAREINSVEDYQRFFHVKAYLRQRSSAYPSPARDLELMVACGYRKAQKFARHRQEWDALGRPIPLTYLAAIGARLDVLAVAAEADLAEFEAALALPLRPRWGIERAMPSIYMNFALPSGTTEAQAIEIILDRSRRTQHECCVHVIGLKTVYANPTGEVSTIFYKPTLQIKGGFLAPRSDGSAVGTCSIGG